MELTEILKDVDAAKRAFNELSKLLRQVTKLNDDRTGHVAELSSKIMRIQTLLEKGTLDAWNPTHLQEWVDTVSEDLSHEKQRAHKLFGHELEQELEPLGITLTGQYPELRAGLFTIELDFERDRATLWLGPRQEQLGRCAISAPAVAALVVQTLKTLGSGLEEEEFFRKLEKAYERTTGGKRGEEAPITSVLAATAFELQSAKFLADPQQQHFKGYSRADFSYDLFRFGYLPAIKLKVASRAYTGSRTGFLWVPTNASGKGTAFSHLSIER